LAGGPVLMRVMRSSKEPARARAGQALTSAPMVAAMPAPRHQCASGGMGWLASRMSMLAAKISPSTVKGSSLAVRPVSPWVVTSS
jgi:hypothetical protein